MVAVVTHPFVSAKGDGSDATLVKPSDWNAQHVITGVGLTGRQAVPIMAGAMIPATTNGPAANLLEMFSFQIMFGTLDFDPTTQESAYFSIPMPKSWNEGTVTFIPVWSHGATTTNFGVVWELAGVAVGDGETGDTIIGTGQTSTDTGGNTNHIYMGPESAAITIANSPAQDDLVFFRVRRLPANASDTLAVDARLHAIKLFITTAEGNDA